MTQFQRLCQTQGKSMQLEKMIILIKGIRALLMNVRHPEMPMIL